MSRKPSPFPVPKLDKRGDSWRIRWFSGGRQYDVTIGEADQRKARALHALAATALASQADWPPELAAHPVVTKYLRDIAGISPTATIPETATALIEGYHQHQHAKLQGESKWPGIVRSHLKRFFAFVGPPDKITVATVSRFFDAMGSMPDLRFNDSTGKTVKNATRNRARTAISGFFRWMRKMGMRPRHWNPLEDIGLLREEPPEGGIIVWTDSEAPALLEAADKLPDGVAVWIAVLAGLRRGEIARLGWKNVAETVITVRATKTGKERQVPLSKQLAARLAREKREGERIVPWPKKMSTWIGHANRLVKERLPRLMPDVHKTAPEKFDWNPFRHTFASRLAQRGHSLDLIAAWLGDSPKVCRDHYARFVPADRRDHRIDDVDI